MQLVAQICNFHPFLTVNDTIQNKICNFRKAGKMQTTGLSNIDENIQQLHPFIIAIQLIRTLRERNFPRQKLHKRKTVSNRPILPRDCCGQSSNRA